MGVLKDGYMFVNLCRFSSRALSVTHKFRIRSRMRDRYLRKGSHKIGSMNSPPVWGQLQIVLCDPVDVHMVVN